MSESPDSSSPPLPGGTAGTLPEMEFLTLGGLAAALSLAAGGISAVAKARAAREKPEELVSFTVSDSDTAEGEHRFNVTLRNEGPDTVILEGLTCTEPEDPAGGPTAWTLPDRFPGGIAEFRQVAFPTRLYAGKELAVQIRLPVAGADSRRRMFRKRKPYVTLRLDFTPLAGREGRVGTDIHLTTYPPVEPGLRTEE